MKYFTKPPIGTPLNLGHPLTRGLVGFWPCWEGGGEKVQDVCASGYHGTLTNVSPSSTSGWSGGKHGRALQFDGSNDYLNLNNAVSLFDGRISISVAFWIRFMGLGGGYSMALEYGGGVSTFSFEGGYTGMTFYVNNSLGLSTTFTLGEWTHVVLWRDGVNSKIFKNGRQAATGADAGALQSKTTFAFGSRPGGTLGLQGFLDNMMIYHRALTVGEIQRLYADPFSMFATETRYYKWRNFSANPWHAYAQQGDSR